MSSKFSRFRQKKRPELTIETRDETPPPASSIAGSRPRQGSRRTIRFATNISTSELRGMGMTKNPVEKSQMPRVIQTDQSFIYTPADKRLVSNGSVSHQVDAVLHAADTVARMISATFMSIDASVTSAGDFGKLTRTPSAVGVHSPHMATFPDVSGTYIFEAISRIHADTYLHEFFREQGVVLPHRSKGDYDVPDTAAAGLLKHVESSHLFRPLRVRCQTAMPDVYMDGVIETMPVWNLISQRRSDFLTETLDKIGEFADTRVRRGVAALLKHPVFSSDDINELILGIGHEFLDILIFLTTNLNEYHIHPTTPWCDFLRMTLHGWLVVSHIVDAESTIRDPRSVNFCADSSYRFTSCTAKAPSSVTGSMVQSSVEENFASGHHLPQGATLPNIATVDSICDFSASLRMFTSSASQLASILNIVRTMRYNDMSRISLLSTHVRNAPSDTDYGAKALGILTAADRIANSQSDESHARRLERLTEHVHGSRESPHAVDRDSAHEAYVATAMARQHSACNTRDAPLVESAQMAFISSAVTIIEAEVRRQCEMLLQKRGASSIAPLLAHLETLSKKFYDKVGPPNVPSE